jgi:nitroimidazol reductase NimA-like FMN-containing flavoprotein (pyridoxamine 5'-phosphate oxidase superfamily)
MPRDYQNAAPTDHQRLPEHTRDEAWIRDLLHRAEIGHLGHARSEQPFVTPLNFRYDEPNQRIIFHTGLAGRMRNNLGHNPRACFEVMEYGRFLPANTALEFGIQYRSAMVFGQVEILNDPEEQRRALYALIAKHFPEMSPGKEFRPITDGELAHTTVYALRIESWSGKENWNEQAEQSEEWPPLRLSLE